jgi:hypothetical protein
MAHTSDEGYVSSLAARPHFLIPPGPQPSHLAEFAALLAWIVESWLSPADADVLVKQQPGREHPAP